MLRRILVNPLHRSFSYVASQNHLDLLGTNKVKQGVELTKHRGDYLNDFLKTNKYYQFLGTSTGISAVNVVMGGQGRIGPYVGGWQINAMKNRLQETLPDTLHVSPEEPGDNAKEVNNHLNRFVQINHLNGVNISGDCAVLADLEQGWSTPEKVRMSVKNAVKNGITMIHIEDQGPYKRCGHLGDKELCPIEDYIVIMRAANFAAQEVLGSGQQWVKFVSRTDAFSAKRMLYSKNLENPEHQDYRFIDWEKGFSPDGKYVYLKQGLNPETGKKWGLEMSIARTARIVKEGLATHVWMETPNADLNDAKDFLEGVNEYLAQFDMKAQGLYNHSPSFDWDLKSYDSAKVLADKLVHNVGSYLQFGQKGLREYLEKVGDKIQGDDKFSESGLERLYYAVNDHHLSKTYSYNFGEKDYYTALFSEQKFKTPYELICDEIVSERLKNFEPQLASFGFNAHLVTLPEYHVMAFNMFKLANQFKDDGMWAYVSQVQRPERIMYEKNNGYLYYKHQTTTGTGLEAKFNEIVGSSNSNILSESTEHDDEKQRKN